MIFLSVSFASSNLFAPSRLPTIIPMLEPMAMNTTLNRLETVEVMLSADTTANPLIE